MVRSWQWKKQKAQKMDLVFLPAELSMKMPEGIGQGEVILVISFLCSVPKCIDQRWE